jgi:hypothetical protein
MRQMMGMPGMRRGTQKAARKGKKKPKGGRPGGSVAARAAAGSRPGGPAGPPASGGQEAITPGAGIPRLPDGFGGPGGDGGFKLPPGLRAPQPNLPPGLRGPVPNRRGRQGKKGR